MKKLIVVNLEYAGQHSFPDCNDPDVSFLKSPHRHLFKIRAKKEVSHNNRDIEIIRFKYLLLDYLKDTYRNQFGTMSCEDIAEDMLKAFDLDYCRVLEDGENGAEVIK